MACENPSHTPERLERISKVSDLPVEELDRKLTDIARNDGNGEMLDEAQAIINRGFGWLYIYGGPGNAKSEVLKAIVNAMNKSGQGPAVYTRLSTILDHMRASMQSGDYTKQFDRLRDVRVLAIDEMDKGKETEWMIDFRFQFLDQRYQSACNEKTLTVFAGNADPSVFDDVLYSRFGDGRFKVVMNSAGDSRPHMRWPDEGKDWVK